MFTCVFLNYLNNLRVNKLTRRIESAGYDLNKVNTNGLGSKDLETFQFLKNNRNKIIESSERSSITSSHDAVMAILNNENFASLDKEKFGVIILDQANKIIDIVVLHEGGRSSSIADFKVIYECILIKKGSSYIMFHNHPSGVTKPSMADQNLTRKAKDNSKLLDIAMLDSIIIGKGGNYLSFADEEMI